MYMIRTFCGKTRIFPLAQTSRKYPLRALLNVREDCAAAVAKGKHQPTTLDRSGTPSIGFAKVASRMTYAILGSRLRTTGMLESVEYR